MFLIHWSKAQINFLMSNTKDTSPLLRIFLCHSSGDKKAVRELYQRLQKSGFIPWLDEIDILPGQDWEAEISRAVRNSDVVLVCLSCGSINKDGFVQKEIKFALDIAQEKTESSIFLIPLKLDDCVVPERLAKLQWVNYFESGGYERLLRALQKRAEQLGMKQKGRLSKPPSLSPLPQNLFQGLIQVFWGWHPFARNVVLILIGTFALAFLVWWLKAKPPEPITPDPSTAPTKETENELRGETVRELLTAWKNSDRDAALKVADPSAVNSLFNVPGLIRRTVNSKDLTCYPAGTDQYDCQISYSNGTLAFRLRKTDQGWWVEKVEKFDD